MWEVTPGLYCGGAAKRGRRDPARRQTDGQMWGGLGGQRWAEVSWPPRTPRLLLLLEVTVLLAVGAGGEGGMDGARF